MGKSRLKKLVIASLIATQSVISTIPLVSAANGELVWNTMQTYEKQEVPLAMKNSRESQNSVSVDSMLAFIQKMQQEQNNQITNLISSINQSNPKNDKDLLQSVQQQQQGLINVFVTMQAANERNMQMIMEAIQKDKSKSNSVDSLTLMNLQQQQLQMSSMLLKLMDKKETPEKVLPTEPIINLSYSSSPVSTNNFDDISYGESITPLKERKRLAPPEEPVPEKSPQIRIEEAVQDAALEGYYQEGMAVFNYRDIALYRIYCQPGYMTVIRLQPGETFKSINAGDTARWTVDVVQAANQTQIMLKPTAGNIDTNFFISTDRHDYQIHAKSTTWHNPTVAWQYPLEKKTIMQKVDGEPDKNARIRLEAIDLKNLNHKYRITSRGAADKWKPAMVFDNGKKVYIDMRNAINNGELPSLMVKQNGEIAVINYRIVNGYYIVDRLFDEAELRLGTGTKNCIRIKRTGSLPTEG